jgi:hypothetical protein
MISHCSGVVVEAGVWSCRFGIKCAQIDRLELGWSDMERCRNQVNIRKNIVQLREGVQALLELLVIREREGDYGRLANLILEAFGEK